MFHERQANKIKNDQINYIILIRNNVDQNVQVKFY